MTGGLGITGGGGGGDGGSEGLNGGGRAGGAMGEGGGLATGQWLAMRCKAGPTQRGLPSTAKVTWCTDNVWMPSLATAKSRALSSLLPPSAGRAAIDLPKRRTKPIPGAFQWQSHWGDEGERMS